MNAETVEPINVPVVQTKPEPETPIPVAMPAVIPQVAVKRFDWTEFRSWTTLVIAVVIAALTIAQSPASSWFKPRLSYTQNRFGTTHTGTCFIGTTCYLFNDSSYVSAKNVVVRLDSHRELEFDINVPHKIQKQGQNGYAIEIPSIPPGGVVHLFAATAWEDDSGLAIAPDVTAIYSDAGIGIENYNSDSYPSPWRIPDLKPATPKIAKVIP
ncbi:MAG: hypothetical protein K8U03_26770 [Planctomycetia bacterium]|nr:hypothetical protein [Planctomycetia bacterium]